MPSHGMSRLDISAPGGGDHPRAPRRPSAAAPWRTTRTQPTMASSRETRRQSSGRRRTARCRDGQRSTLPWRSRRLSSPLRAGRCHMACSRDGHHSTPPLRLNRRRATHRMGGEDTPLSWRRHMQHNPWRSLLCRAWAPCQDPQNAPCRSLLCRALDRRSDAQHPPRRRIQLPRDRGPVGSSR